MILVYIVANGVCMAICVKIIKKLGHCFSVLATINLEPLFLQGWMNAWIDYFGISIQSYLLQYLVKSGH